MKGIAAATLLFVSLGAQSLEAQQKSAGSGKTLSGTWRVEQGKVKQAGPKLVVIRNDSSASWGKETVRWRIKDLKDKQRQIMIAIGGEWEIYDIKIKGDKMILSGGDLSDAITLKRVGPETPRPASIPVPPDPDKESGN